MTTIKLPAHTTRKRLAGGGWAYYWSLPPWARPKKDKAGRLIPVVRNGRPCPVVSTPLGQQLGEAITKAEALNEAFKGWRTGTADVVVKGSVRWLFSWYRDQDRFKKNSHKTRTDYIKLMNMLERYPMKSGLLGQRSASAVDATVADKLYKKLRKRGERQGTYAMQVCRLVWTWALRHKRTTGVTENPFSKMGLKSTPMRSRSSMCCPAARRRCFIRNSRKSSADRSRCARAS